MGSCNPSLTLAAEGTDESSGEMCWPALCRGSNRTLFTFNRAS